MEKRILSIALVVLLVVALVPTALAANYTAECTYDEIVQWTVTNVSDGVFAMYDFPALKTRPVDNSGSPVDVPVYYGQAPMKVELSNGNVWGDWMAWESGSTKAVMGSTTSPVKYDRVAAGKDSVAGTLFTVNAGGIYELTFKYELADGTVEHGYMVLVVEALNAVATAPTLNTSILRPIPPLPTRADINHLVAKGETLAAIANMYGVTTATIKKSNVVYFSQLDAKNRENKTNITVEAGVTIFIPNATQALVYTVRTGETLASIATNYYGNPNDATIKAIIRANEEYFMCTDNVLEAGVTIILPAKGLRDPISRIALSYAPPAAYVYQVKSGDTLSGISRAVYGDSKYWTRISDANKDRIKATTIYAGQLLVIPYI